VFAVSGSAVMTDSPVLRVISQKVDSYGRWSGVLVQARQTEQKDNGNLYCVLGIMQKDVYMVLSKCF
jgi:hypothetical protein